MGIHDDDYVVVDFTVKPISRRAQEGQDAVLIWNRGRLMVKEYIGAWGCEQMVGTRYKNPYPAAHGKMDSALMADYIFGVVKACYDNSFNLRWERNLTGYPSELSGEQMIRGVNVGTPTRL